MIEVADGRRVWRVRRRNLAPEPAHHFVGADACRLELLREIDGEPR